MKLTIKDFTKKKKIKNGDDLAKLSDMIWEIGDLEGIKSKTTPELFTLHIIMNMIGNWQGSGWLGILNYQKELVPYIPHALAALELYEMKNSFEEIASLYPDIKKFSVEEEKNYCEKLEDLENISDPNWGCNAPKEGWDCVLNYLKKIS